MRKRTWSAIVILAALLLSVSALFAAGGGDDSAIDSGEAVHGHAHHQHGGGEGHLPATSENVRLVGKMNINQDFPGRVSDVGAHKNHAYIGSFWEPDCQKGGVYVFDIANPTQPKQINFIRTGNNSYVGEGVQVINITTPKFSGDVLILNNEVCGPPNTGAVGGISLVDVTNPKVHKYLAEGVGDFAPQSWNGPGLAHEVHSAFAWDAGDKAYAVLVDNEEDSDVDIMDITDPRAPKLITEYDLVAQMPQIVQPDLGTVEVFLHDMIVKNINGRWIMLLSYWDAGYVVLDVTNPLNPTYIADSDFKNPDPEAALYGYNVKPEGNGHQAEFSLDNKYIVATDEDFNPYTTGAFRIASGVNAGEYPSVSVGGGAPVTVLPDNTLNGPTVYGGYGCPGSAPIPLRSDVNLGTLAPGEEAILVLQRGPVGDPSAPEEACFPGEKAANAIAAGYDAVVLVQRHLGSASADEPYCGSGAYPPGSQIVTVCTTHEAFHKIFGSIPAFDLPYKPETEPARGSVGERVEVAASFDGWGYVHLFKNERGKLTELDTYAIPEAFDPGRATNSGDLSVHEVAMSEKRSDLAYFAYYAGGFRVTKIVTDKGKTTLKEVGRYIEEGGSNFWGVQVWQNGGKEYVLASDRDYGVYIFEYTGQ